uniref:Tospovirus resistance protein C n=1 Tax=Solanum tuberosum TaxID=4113 RepID=M1AS81_SOLTU
MPKRMKKKQIQKKHFMKKHFTKRMKKKKTQKKMKKKRIQKKQILKRMKKKSKEDENDISRKPCYLLFLVVLVELEMQKIILGELKASKFAQSRIFKDKILPKGFSYHLRNLLVYLRNEKLKKLPTNVTARNIDVAIEFLLVFLGDVPNHVINGKGLNEVLANIGVLVGDVLCVIQMLLAESTIKEDSSKIDLDTMQILVKIEDLRAQVEERDVAKVQHKHDEIPKDLQRCALNLAYEAEVSIDSILVKYNALWHSFCSLPAIIEEINHINVEVTKMGSVNLALRPFFVVEPSKHLLPQHSNVMNDDDDIVGFEDDTKIIIQHLI